MGITQRDVPPETWRALTEAGKAKASPARPVLVGPTPGELAAAEVARWCRESGRPAPVTEYRFAPPRKWRFDLAWVGLMLAVEFQGGVWARGRHNRPRGFANDCAKFSTAASLGWRVMPVTYAQVRNGMLLGWLRRAMEAH